MKNLLFIILLCFVSNSFCQTQVVFDYDTAGNQIKRYLIDIPSDKQIINAPISINDIVEADLIKADIYDDIKYYPNPVQEELYLQWELTNDNKVVSITLYTISGQLVRKVTDTQKDNTYIFPFRELPQAIYSLVLNYSNGEQKSLKIIKH